MDELKVLINMGVYDTVGITNTWLKNKLYLNIYILHLNIRGSGMFREDKRGSKKGKLLRCLLKIALLQYLERLLK